jgi:hypothetical protein
MCAPCKQLDRGGMRKQAFLSKRLTLRRQRMLEDLELEKRKCPACGSETQQTDPDEDDPKEDW